MIVHGQTASSDPHFHVTYNGKTSWIAQKDLPVPLTDSTVQWDLKCERELPVLTSPVKKKRKRERVALDPFEESKLDSRRIATQSMRRLLWETYSRGKYHLPCYCCGCELNPFTFEAGHNIPYCEGGTTSIDNLRIICAQCNKSMTVRNSQNRQHTCDEWRTYLKKVKRKSSWFTLWTW